MFEFGVRFFNGKTLMGCFLINAPTNKDATEWAKRQAEHTNSGSVVGDLNDCDVVIECFGPHQ